MLDQRTDSVLLATHTCSEQRGFILSILSVDIGTYWCSRRSRVISNCDSFMCMWVRISV